MFLIISRLETTSNDEVFTIINARERFWRIHEFQRQIP